MLVQNCGKDGKGGLGSRNLEQFPLKLQANPMTGLSPWKGPGASEC